MQRVGGAILGGILGVLMAGAATLLLFSLCVVVGPDAESCGMGMLLFPFSAFVLAGGSFGMLAGFAVPSRDRLTQLGSALGGALGGVVAPFVLLLIVLVFRGEGSPPVNDGMEMTLSDTLSTAARDSLHRAVRVESLTTAAVMSLPAILSVAGAVLGWRAGRRKGAPPVGEDQEPGGPPAPPAEPT